jgi:hypothetical protein
MGLADAQRELETRWQKVYPAASQVKKKARCRDCGQQCGPPYAGALFDIEPRVTKRDTSGAQ